MLTKSVKVMVFPAVMLVVVSASKVTVLNVLFWVMLRVPAELVIGPVKVLSPERVKVLLLEFCTIPVTLAPITPEIVTDPVSVFEFVIKPVKFTEPERTVCLPPPEENHKLFVPVISPLNVPVPLWPPELPR